MCARWHRGYAYQPIAPMYQHEETAAGLQRLNGTAIKARSHNYKGSVMPLQSRDNDTIAYFLKAPGRYPAT